MKANTRLENRLAFDVVADTYDAARPVFSEAIVTNMAAIAGIERGADVFEIGAGSGQLTRSLVSAGFRVTALEPGDRLRELLADNLASEPELRIVGGYFSDYKPRGAQFDAIFAANSFHWLNPQTAYTESADLLRPNGRLCLLWNFPIAQPDVQHFLNESAFADLPDHVKDPNDFLSNIKVSLDDGRTELSASGRFYDPWWQIEEEGLLLSAPQYARLVVSYASTAALSSGFQQGIEESVAKDLKSLGLTHVPLVNYIYSCIAQVR